MNKAMRTTAIVFGINMVLVVLMLLGQNTEGTFISIGLLWIFGMIVQFMLGVVFVFIERLRPTGQGLLLGTLLSLVIGFSVCSALIR
ncbi:hypothetical protein HRG84_01690 [Flavisolibacter sp. BT320]|nr:hypothetical protein [Flavisolibacter longurius]